MIRRRTGSFHPRISPSPFHSSFRLPDETDLIDDASRLLEEGEGGREAEQVKFQISATMGELCVLAYAPSSFADSPSGWAVTTGGSGGGGGGGWGGGGGAAGEEVLQLTAVLSGASCDFSMRPHDMAAAVTLRALTVTDCLSARGNGTDLQVLSSELVPLSASADASADSSGIAADSPSLTPLARVIYASWTKSSPDYSGVGMDVSVRFGALALAVRRPTVVSLAELPGKLLQGVNTAGGGEAVAAAEARAALEPPEEVPPAPDLVLSADPTAMKVSFGMEAVSMQLLLENGEELAAMSVERLEGRLAMHAAAMDVDVSLGNLRLRDSRRAAQQGGCRPAASLRSSSAGGV